MSRRDAVRAGKAVGGAPFGYRFRDSTRRGEAGVIDSRLAPDETASVIREVSSVRPAARAGPNWRAGSTARHRSRMSGSGPGKPWSR